MVAEDKESRHIMKELGIGVCIFFDSHSLSSHASTFELTLAYQCSNFRSFQDIYRGNAYLLSALRIVC